MTTLSNNREPLQAAVDNAVTGKPVTARYLDYDGAGQYLGTTGRHVRELKRRGEIPYLRIGALIRFPVDVLDEWARNRIVHPR
ncbi:MAG: excisionase family DNA-binding protein [Actinomycetota bacterium]